MYFFTGEFLLTFNPTLTYYPKVILNIEIVLEKIEDFKINVFNKLKNSFEVNNL